MTNSILVDNITFSQIPVTLPVSAPRPGKQLIGFDRSFIQNRQSSTQFDILSTLQSKYQVEQNKDGFDFYLPKLDLYIDSRLDRLHNFSAYNQSDKWHQHCLNQLIENQDSDLIRQWCILDPQKRLLTQNLKYLEIFELNDAQDLFTQIKRVSSGLEYIYPHTEMLKEFESIVKFKDIAFDKTVTSNKITLTFQPHFYRAENDLYQSDPFWRRRLIDNCKAFLYKKEHELNDKEMLRQIKIAGLHDGFSQHSPLWIKSFINKYQVQSIYDPTGGWGHRLLGSHNIKYIYNDNDPDTFQGAQNIANFLQLKDKTFYCRNSELFTPTEDYEAVVTCPPYFTVEHYYGAQTSTKLFKEYNDWLNNWWRKTIQSSLKPSVKFFAFIINNQYKKDMIKICLEEGLELIEEIPVGKKTNLNHFQRTALSKDNNSNKKGEQIVILRKK